MKRQKRTHAVYKDRDLFTRGLVLRATLCGLQVTRSMFLTTNDDLVNCRCCRMVLNAEAARARRMDT